MGVRRPRRPTGQGGDHAEMVMVRAVGPGGAEVRFEAFHGEHEVGAVVEVTIRAT